MLRAPVNKGLELVRSLSEKNHIRATCHVPPQMVLTHL